MYTLTCELLDSGITVLSRVASHNTDHVTELSLNHNELYTLEGISSYTSLQKVGSNLQVACVNEHTCFL